MHRVYDGIACALCAGPLCSEGILPEATPIDGFLPDSPWFIECADCLHDPLGAANIIHLWNSQMTFRGPDLNSVMHFGGSDDYDRDVIHFEDVQWLNHVRIIGQNNNIVDGPKYVHP